MGSRATINSDTFDEIMSDKEDVLAKMASALGGIELDELMGNITCRGDNPNNVDYIMKMPDDNLIIIRNVKTDKMVIINLKKGDNFK